MHERCSLLDGRVAPSRPLRPLRARLDPRQTRVGRSRLGGEVGAGEHDPLGIDGEETAGHADHRRRFAAPHLDQRRGRVAQLHLHHLPHPGVHVEGPREAVGELRIVERQTMVKAGIVEGLGADVGLHPRCLSAQLDRVGKEDDVVAPPYPLGHLWPDEGGEPYGREHNGDRAEPHTPRENCLPDRGLLRGELGERGAAAGIGCHGIAGRPVTTARSGG